MNERFERAGQKHERVAKHKVVALLDLHVALHVLTDYLDFTCSVRSVGQHSDDQMRVVAAEVVEGHWNVEHYPTLPIALIMRCTNVISCYMIMIGHFAIVVDVGIEWAVLTATNAAQNCIVMVCLLLTR